MRRSIIYIFCILFTTSFQLNAQQEVSYNFLRENIATINQEEVLLQVEQSYLETFAKKWILKISKDSDLENLQFERVAVESVSEKGWYLVAKASLKEQTIHYRNHLQHLDNQLVLTETEVMEICICNSCDEGGFATDRGCFCDDSDEGTCEHQFFISLQ